MAKESKADKADFRPYRSDLRSDRADFRSEMADIRPEMASFRLERPNGGEDGRTDKWTEEQQSPCILQDLVSFGAAAQKGTEKRT